MLSKLNISTIKYVISILVFFLSLYIVIFLSSCAHKTPTQTDKICEIFSQKKSWYKYAKMSTKKWGTPINVQMAILQQESGFRYDAKPGRKKLLGFIPWKRESSAYGYAQVLTDTWKQYAKETKNRGADRDSFKDSIDFVGWYTYHTQKQTKVSKWDAYNQYLAYHEGRNGFIKKSYINKKWLIKVAQKVDRISKSYASQLKSCK
ncbi:MAG: transglycosylase SLT domain-containing protein [Alcanivoracaceae bacterium]|nr:transglycosylase SLT domain-containing protein [Alcanivoracaceae bacterium]